MALRYSAKIGRLIVNNSDALAGITNHVGHRCNRPEDTRRAAAGRASEQSQARGLIIAVAYGGAGAHQRLIRDGYIPQASEASSNPAKLDSGMTVFVGAAGSHRAEHLRYLQRQQSGHRNRGIHGGRGFDYLIKLRVRDAGDRGPCYDRPGTRVIREGWRSRCRCGQPHPDQQRSAPSFPGKRRITGLGTGLLLLVVLQVVFASHWMRVLTKSCGSPHRVRWRYRLPLGRGLPRKTAPEGAVFAGPKKITASSLLCSRTAAAGRLREQRRLKTRQLWRATDDFNGFPTSAFDLEHGHSLPSLDVALVFKTRSCR